VRLTETVEFERTGLWPGGPSRKGFARAVGFLAWSARRNHNFAISPRFEGEGTRTAGGKAMKIVSGFTALALLLVSGFAASAQKVTVVGCPVPGVEPKCLVIRGEDNVTYNISGAKNRPNIGQRAIRLTGTKTRKVSYCMQGVVLDRISWTYIDQKCSQ
jgi:hypothetical protein